jgi:hypothetical protein
VVHASKYLEANAVLGDPAHVALIWCARLLLLLGMGAGLGGLAMAVAADGISLWQLVLAIGVIFMLFAIALGISEIARLAYLRYKADQAAGVVP